MDFDDLPVQTIFKAPNGCILQKLSHTTFNVLQTRFGPVRSFSENGIAYSGYFHPIQIRYSDAGKPIHKPVVLEVINAG